MSPSLYWYSLGFVRARPLFKDYYWRLCSPLTNTRTALSVERPLFGNCSRLLTIYLPSQQNDSLLYVGYT